MKNISWSIIFASLEAHANVKDKSGLYVAYFSSEEMNRIREKALNIKYFELQGKTG